MDETIPDPTIDSIDFDASTDKRINVSPETV